MEMSVGSLIALGGVTMTSLITMGKMMYNYGRDRKELNGTVERVKKVESNLLNIDKKFDEHVRDEKRDMIQMHEDIKAIGTKVDLLVDGKITNR